MAAARASSNRPWSSSWSRAAAMSGQARRTTSPPARARLRKYLAWRSRVASSRAVSARRRRAKPRTSSGTTNRGSPVAAGVEVEQVRVDELEQDVGGVAGGRAEVHHRAPRRRAGTGPRTPRAGRTCAAPPSDSRSTLHVEGGVDAAPCAEGAGHRPPAAPRRRGPPPARWCREPAGLSADAGDVGADVGVVEVDVHPSGRARAAKSSRAGWSGGCVVVGQRQRGQPDHALADRRGSAATPWHRTVAAG